MPAWPTRSNIRSSDGSEATIAAPMPTPAPAGSRPLTPEPRKLPLSSDRAPAERVKTPAPDARRRPVTDRNKASEAIGQEYGAYTITREIGRGGMAVVYEGRHATLGRSAAIKVLHDHLAGVEAATSCFEAEAIAISRIRHPGVVSVFDHGHDARGRAYLVMELLVGESLTERMNREPHLTLTESIELAIQIAEALAAAHDLGVVHRDLKPDNIILVPGPGGWPQAKLLDFGLAKVRGELTAATEIKDVLSGAARAVEGSVLGTPEYMAPEQVTEPERVDERADVYALGIILYQMVCNRLPWRGDVIELANPDRRPPRAPRTIVPSMPIALDRLILRMLARAPEARPGKLREVAAALRSIEEDTPRTPSVAIDTTKLAAAAKAATADAASGDAETDPAASRPVGEDTSLVELRRASPASKAWRTLAIAAVAVAAGQVALAWALGLLG